MPNTLPSLVLLNTDQTVVGDPTLARTTFHLDSDEHSEVNKIYLHLDEGGHEPSPEESSLAPFYQALSHRVFAIELCSPYYTFVMKTETLLRLAQERRGANLPWGQWKAHTVELDSALDWVSGTQLFLTRIVPQNEDTWLEVYDFSPRASKMYVITNRGGIVRQVVQPCMREHYLPWNSSTIDISNGGHDSIAVITVNALLQSPRSDLILTSVSYDRCPRVAKIRPCVHCMCGPFESHCMISIHQFRVRYFVSEVVLRTSGNLSGWNYSTSTYSPTVRSDRCRWNRTHVNVRLPPSEPNDFSSGKLGPRFGRGRYAQSTLKEPFPSARLFNSS